MLGDQKNSSVRVDARFQGLLFAFFSASFPPHVLSQSMSREVATGADERDGSNFFLSFDRASTLVHARSLCISHYAVNKSKENRALLFADALMAPAGVGGPRGTPPIPWLVVYRRKITILGVFPLRNWYVESRISPLVNGRCLSTASLLRPSGSLSAKQLPLESNAAAAGRGIRTWGQ